MPQDLTVIGIMSGTSLDGLDICCVQLCHVNNSYTYKVLATETFTFPVEWKKRLEAAYHQDINDLAEIDKDYGKFIGKLVNLFILKNKLKGKVELIGSHGQTIFHEPDKGITVQIGAGPEIAEATGINVINDFRIRDVELGGQGAPLVPIGDRLLFGAYASCLNLGGIANISYEQGDKRIAFDICPANLPLNKIVKEKFDISFDRNGEIAQSGTVIQDLLNALNDLSYYSQDPPKSLGYEWLDREFYPVIKNFSDKPVANVLRTVIEHESTQISKILNARQLSNCLVTGGGALNTFFVEQIQQKTTTEIIIPDLQLIEFKEALIFAFLAYLHVNQQVNTLASVTGAKNDSIGGKLHLAFTDE
ncbi:MAG: anhydro-N-acetylmuramic acid kinase [Crocinitomicaceae bacterium]|nr:anhydro-N-acetylmuramic acid kinase [Crocinitomicaceae bacterium]